MTTITAVLQAAPIWPGWAIVGSLAGALIVAVVTSQNQKKTAMFYYGKLTEKVDGQEADIKELRTAKDEHEKRISHVEGVLEGGKASGASAGRFV